MKRITLLTLALLLVAFAPFPTNEHATDVIGCTQNDTNCHLMLGPEDNRAARVVLKPSETFTVGFASTRANPSWLHLRVRNWGPDVWITCEAQNAYRGYLGHVNIKVKNTAGQFKWQVVDFNLVGVKEFERAACYKRDAGSVVLYIDAWTAWQRDRWHQLMPVMRMETRGPVPPH